MKQKKVFLVALQVLASIPLLIVFLGVVWQVFSRYILSVPSKNTEELIRFSLIFLTFLAGSYCFILNRHISLELLESKHESLFKKILSTVRITIILVFSMLILVYGGLLKAISQLEQLSSSFNISMLYIYAVMPISGIFVVVWASREYFYIWTRTRI